MDEGVHVEVAEGDSCTGRIAAYSGVWVGEDCVLVRKDMVEHVILEVDAGEWLAVHAFDGERLPVVGLGSVRGRRVSTTLCAASERTYPEGGMAGEGREEEG